MPPRYAILSLVAILFVVSIAAIFVFPPTAQSDVERTTTTTETGRLLNATISSDDTVSTGAILWYSVSVEWIDNPVVANITIPLVDPSGVEQTLSTRETSPYGLANMYWNVPRDAKLGEYRLEVTVVKAGYQSSQASTTFEVI